MPRRSRSNRSFPVPLDLGALDSEFTSYAREVNSRIISTQPHSHVALPRNRRAAVESVLNSFVQGLASRRVLDEFDVDTNPPDSIPTSPVIPEEERESDIVTACTIEEGGGRQMPSFAMPDRRYGVELEANPVLTMDTVASLISGQGETVRNLGRAYEHTRNNIDWVVKGDSSCGSPEEYWGVEVCTPVMRGPESLARFHGVVEAVNNYAKRNALVLCNSKCGVHVHVDTSNYQKSDLRKLVLLYLRFERIIFGMVARNRFDSTYCKPWRMVETFGEDVIQVFSRAKSDHQIRQAYNTVFCRYHGAHSDMPRNLGLNLANFWRYGRVEFRMHEGTWDPQVVVNWARLLVTMVDVAQKMRSVRVDGPDTLNSLFELLGWETEDAGAVALKKYFRSRYREVQVQSSVVSRSVAHVQASF